MRVKLYDSAISYKEIEIDHEDYSEIRSPNPTDIPTHVLVHPDKMTIENTEFNYNRYLKRPIMVSEKFIASVFIHELCSTDQFISDIILDYLKQ